jgi:CRP-like cAMP-binding protein
MNSLFECIYNYHPISEEARLSLSNVLRKVELPKSSILIKEGIICNHLFFLEQGCLRGFSNLDGKEVTHWFAFENDFVTSVYSFISRKPSLENIHALEDSVLWSVSYEDLQRLFDTYPDIERMTRIIYERAYIRLEERLVRLQFKSAKERYEQITTVFPTILNRVSLGHIASYLGISQETLSRIRAQG